VVRPRSYRIIYYFDTPALGRKHQSFGRVNPLGVIEDVLVKIDNLVIPCDFYILNMEHDSCDSSNNTPILFGRPFLKSANTKIDCGKDTLSIEVGDEKI